MKKQKLSLKKLSVQSFITGLNKENKAFLKGGDPTCTFGISECFECYQSEGPCIENIYSIHNNYCEQLISVPC